VGGAEAGEVASQTAIEVLDEAFRHRLENADIEDLMELAISTRERIDPPDGAGHAKVFDDGKQPSLRLHVQGNIATIGHVGDSRLYRLTPAGQIDSRDC